MTPPNSTPDDAQNNSMDEQGDSSSMDETLLEAAALSRQGSQQTGFVINQAELDSFEQVLRNIPPNTSGRYSLVRSDSEFTDRTDASVHNHYDNSVPIDAELYMLIVSGKKDDILAKGANLWELNSTEDNNSVLHIAASAGQSLLISDILPVCKDIIRRKNSKGDLAFHCAAKAAQFNALKALTDWTKYDGQGGISSELLGLENDEGDTALHIVLENNQKEMAWLLVDQYCQACYQSNKKGVSPLYLAIKSGYWELVKHMISYTKQHKPASEDALLRVKSVVHAAIEAKNIDILKEILENHKQLLESFNDEHQTPLSYAAYKGYLEGVQYLLKKFPNCAYKRDKDEDGSFPIHKAASGGKIKVIKELYSTKQLFNKRGQSILHVACGSGKSKVVAYVLKRQELERLINLKDEEGNTPLHLATKGFHARVVYILTRERRVKLELQNKDGLTALDVADIHPGVSPTFEARLTWMALRYVDAPRSSQPTRKSYMKKQLTKKQEYPHYLKRNQNANDKGESESFKDRVDTHLLVATLVATVTFAAGFTAPGGYKQDGPNIGMAVLADKLPFQVFVICNTAALYSSILSVVTLIWAHMGDLKLILVSLKFALPLLGFSLTMMSLAFMLGIFVVLRTIPWLSFLVLGLGSVFLLIVLVFFIPLYNPSYIRNPIVRFFFSGTFLLLLLVCDKSTIQYG